MTRSSPRPLPKAVLFLDGNFGAEWALSMDGVLEQSDVALSSDLEEAILEWEEKFRLDNSPTLGWKSEQAKHTFSASGRTLADRIASEIGHQFAVSFEDEIIRSEEEAAVPLAAQSIENLLAEQLEVNRSMNGKTGSLHWRFN